MNCEDCAELYSKGTADREPPCEQCFVLLDESNVENWNIYLLVQNQIKVAPMGEIIGLDYAAVLNVIKLYVAADKVKKTFESILVCYNIEQEFVGIKR